MDGIPVTFPFRGHEIHGTLSQPSGMGQVWFLMVDNYYWGKLIKTENFGWQFHAQRTEREELNSLVDFFEAVVISYYQ